METIKKYVIIANRWFDKINGNTYHSVVVIDTENFSKLIYQSGRVYGYGESYKQTAYDGLLKLDLVKEEDRFNHELNKNRFLFICSDVKTKKELVV